ncbi:MAG: hypothetical protein HZB50_08415 [Chloroflexi bacterium]|nr:hypothetical protein [Chloroflexota bacterium]
MDNSKRNFSLLQTAKNILANITFVVVDILFSLWYTPFLIRKLGSELFGFIPLANSVTNYFSIVTQSLNISVGRHITVELARGKTRRANQVFNTNLIASLLLISAAIPLGVILVAFAPLFFKIPLGHERDIQLLFVGVVTAFLLVTFRINFSVATFARNRFDLRNVSSLGARVIQILVILGLFSLDRPNIFYVGIGAACAALFNLAGDYFLWRLLLPELKVYWNDFRKRDLKLIFNSGALTFIYQIGFMLFNVEMLVANRILDLHLVGMYAALITIPKNLRIISSAIGGVWGPSILAKYGQDDHQGIDSILLGSVKLIGLTLALPIGLICGLALPFLTVWLGPDFREMSWILAVMVFPLSTNLIVEPFFNINISLNKLKIPALVTFGLGLLNLLLAVFLAPRYGVIGIVAAGVLTLTLNYSIFIPIYTAMTMNLPWWRYVQRLGGVSLATLGVTVTSYLLSDVVSLTSYFRLIAAGGSISLIYLTSAYFLGLSNVEKELLKNFFASIYARK